MPMRKALELEESLRRIERLLRLGSWSFNVDRHELKWSQGLYLMFGLNPQELLPDISVLQGFIHPEDRQPWSAIVAAVSQSRNTARSLRIIRSNGEMIWTRSMIEGQFDRSGALRAVHGVLFDVTDLERPVQQAEYDLKLLHSLRKLPKCSVWRADPRGHLIEDNVWSRLTGQALEQVAVWEEEGLSAIHAEDREGFRSAWLEGIQSKSPIRFRARIEGRHGDFVAFESFAIPVEDDAGAIAEWHGISVPRQETVPALSIQLAPAHVRAARALLDWSGHDLAEKSQVSFSTIKRLEAGEHVKPDLLERIRQCLDAAGVQFIEPNDGSGEIWVRRRKLSS